MRCVESVPFILKLVTQQDDTGQKYAVILWVALISYIPEKSTQGVPMWYPSATQALPSTTCVVSKWYPCHTQVVSEWSQKLLQRYGKIKQVCL